MNQSKGPAEALLWDSVARRYYLRGESKVEIAAHLGISRFKVARMLEEALSSGFVRIDIRSPSGLDSELGEALCHRLGLRRAVAVRSDSNVDVLREQLGTAAATLVTEVVGPADVLGLPWSRSVNDMVNRLTVLPRIPVVQLCGSLIMAGEDGSSLDVVHRAARAAGGPSHAFHAPLALDDRVSAASLRRHGAVSDALAHISDVTVAVVGVGAWLRGFSTLFDAVSAQSQASVTAAGAVGEIAGVLFDAAGRPVPTDLTERLIGISADQLQAVPHVIAVAHGPAKVAAIASAINGGLIHSLVTTTETGRSLLSLAPSAPAATA